MIFEGLTFPELATTICSIDLCTGEESKKVEFWVPFCVLSTLVSGFFDLDPRKFFGVLGVFESVLEMVS